MNPIPATQGSKIKKPVISVSGIIKSNANARPPYPDCLRYNALSKEESRLMRSLMKTHILVAHKGKALMPPPPPPHSKDKVIPAKNEIEKIAQQQPSDRRLIQPVNATAKIIDSAHNSKRQRDDENNDNNEQPNKLSKFFTIPTQNRFAPLQTREINPQEESEAMEPEEPAIITKTNTSAADEIREKAKQTLSKKQQKPPPIVITGQIDNSRQLREFRATLDKITKSNYTLKFTKRTTLIQTNTCEDFDAVKTHMTNVAAIPWHTYSTTTEKTHAYVLRGLDHKPEPDEVLNELKQENIGVMKV